MNLNLLHRSLRSIRILKRVLLKPKDLPVLFQSANGIRQYERFAGWLNRKDIRRRKRLLNTLPASGTLGRIDSGIGFLRIHIDPKDTVIASALGRCTEILNNPETWDKAKGQTAFMGRKRLDPQCSEDTVVFRLSTDPRILGPIAEYLGQIPILERAVVWYAPSTRELEDTSQHLHRDADGLSQIKVFVFLDDVTDESGPLHVLSSKDSSRLYDTLAHGDRGAQVRSQYQLKLQDEEFEPLIPENSLKIQTGPSGTIVMADTCRCYHFGSRPGTRTRKILMMKYVKPTARSQPLWGRQDMQASPVMEASHEVDKSVLSALFAEVM